MEALQGSGNRSPGRMNVARRADAAVDGERVNADSTARRRASPPDQALHARITSSNPLCNEGGGKRLYVLAVASVFCIFLRATIFAEYVEAITGISSSSLQYGGVSLAAYYALPTGLQKKRSFSIPFLILVVMTLGSILYSPMQEVSLLRWAGWCLMGFASLSDTALSRQFREVQWKCSLVCMCGTGVIGVIWWSLRLPDLGYGGFTGIISHVMLLGPIAGIGAVYAFTRISLKFSIKWFGVFSACAFVCMLATSRAAVLSMVVGIVVVRLLMSASRNVPAIVLVGAFLYVVFENGAIGDTLDSILPTQMTEKFLTKGLKNSRDELWEQRWKEFAEHPLFGIGFAMAEWDTVGTDIETFNIEPGSSYLAILSQTGLMGASGCILLLCCIAYRLRNNWQHIPNGERIVAISIGACFGVHMAAEGYLLAVGSPLCFFVWVAIARLWDISSMRSPARSAPRRELTA